MGGGSSVCQPTGLDPAGGGTSPKKVKKVPLSARALENFQKALQENEVPLYRRIAEERRQLLANGVPLSARALENFQKGLQEHEVPIYRRREDERRQLRAQHLANKQRIKERQNEKKEQADPQQETQPTKYEGQSEGEEGVSTRNTTPTRLGFPQAT